MASFKFAVQPSNPEQPLGLEFWVNNHCVFDTDSLASPEIIAHDFDDDDEGQHEFRWVLKNKLPEHTELNDRGNIVSDSIITLSDFELEDIDITQIVYDRAVYQHNFNDSADAIDDLFFGAMGCNGTVTLKFTTPIYVWLLEVM
jgi:hypothetical protein